MFASDSEGDRPACAGAASSDGTEGQGEGTSAGQGNGESDGKGQASNDGAEGQGDGTSDGEGNGESDGKGQASADGAEGQGDDTSDGKGKAAWAMPWPESSAAGEDGKQEETTMLALCDQVDHGEQRTPHEQEEKEKRRTWRKR